MKLPKILHRFAEIFNNNNFKIFLVGGAVRDYLLNGKYTDYDFTTDAQPGEIMKMFNSVIPVGIEHGTVIVNFEDSHFEVTTFRTEGKYSDNRHPDEVSFVRSIDEDLKRRDFTINAIAYDIMNNNLIDNYQGNADLKKGIIRAIGNPEERFNEDGLRMMRACRFASQLNFKIDDETLNAITKLHENISRISNERIRDEFIKTMNSDKPSICIEYMRITGLLGEILPELNVCYGVYQNKFHRFDVYYHNLYSCDAAVKDNYIIRIAALFHDIAKPQTKRGKETKEEENSFYNHEVIGSKTAKRILKRLKFKNSDITAISHLIKHHMFYYTEAWTDGAVRRFIKNIGLENIEDLFKLREADRIGNGTKSGIPEAFIKFQERIRKILEIDSAFKVTDLNINGNDLIKALDLRSGPLIGEILNYLLEIVLDNPGMNVNEMLIQKAVEYYKKKEEYSIKTYGKKPDELGRF